MQASDLGLWIYIIAIVRRSERQWMLQTRTQGDDLISIARFPPHVYCHEDMVLFLPGALLQMDVRQPTRHDQSTTTSPNKVAHANPSNLPISAK